MVDLCRPLCIIATKFLYMLAFMEVEKNKKILHTSHKECRSNYSQRSTKVNCVRLPLVPMFGQ